MSYLRMNAGFSADARDGQPAGLPAPEIRGRSERVGSSGGVQRKVTHLRARYLSSLRRQWFIRPHAVLLLSRPSGRTTAESERHLDPLHKDGQPVALPGVGTNRAVRFAVGWIDQFHGGNSLFRPR